MYVHVVVSIGMYAMSHMYWKVFNDLYVLVCIVCIALYCTL